MTTVSLRAAFPTLFLLVAGLAYGRQNSKPISPEVQRLFDAAVGPSIALADRIPMLEQALAKARDLKDVEGQALVLGNLGHYRQGLHQTDLAVTLLRKASALFHETKDLAGEMLTQSELGVTLRGAGQVAAAEDALQQALTIAERLDDKGEEALCLAQLSSVESDKGRPQDALLSAQKAFSIFQALDRPGDEAQVLNCLVPIYGGLGRYADAVDAGNKAIEIFRSLNITQGKAMSYYLLGEMAYGVGKLRESDGFYSTALDIFNRIGDDEGVAHTLTDWGVTNHSEGLLAEATSRYAKALAIAKKIGAKPLVLADLTNIGIDCTELGQPDKALVYHGQALSLSRETHDLRGQGRVLNNIAVADALLGRRESALKDYQQALSVAKQLGDSNFTALALFNIGKEYRTLGQYALSLEYMRKAGEIYQRLGQQEGFSVVLSESAMSQFHRHRPLVALKLLDQALTLQRSMGSTLHSIETLYSEASIYMADGDLSKARALCEEGLGVARKDQARQWQGILLSFLGGLSAQSGNLDGAISLCLQSLPIEEAVGDRDEQALTLAIMATATRSSSPDLAVYYFKRSVNLYQGLRRDISHLENESRTAYTLTVAEAYRELASLLVASGRLAEAEEVLGLLKDDELYEFVRRADSTLGGRAEFTAEEAEWDRGYEAHTKDLVALGREEQYLLAIHERSPAEAARLKQVQSQALEAEKAFRDFLDRVLSQSKLAKISAKHTGLLQGRQRLQATLARLPVGSAAVYTLLAPDALRMIFVTSRVTRALTVQITPAQVNARVDAFRHALQDPSQDPRIAGKALYDILVKPIESDLSSSKASHVMWSLDGSLRYIPLAALWDGKRFLVQRMAQSVFNLSSSDKLAGDPKRKWRALAGGVSQARTVKDDGGGVHKFPALSAVPLELAAVTHTFPGSKQLLDPAFTIGNLEAELSRKPNLVHLATHFSFSVGDETMSFLLTGRGPVLSVGRARTLANLSLRNVALFTLSACNTGLGGTFGDGSEVESIAVIFQKKGAQAVLSSLWPVSDVATRLLMSRFYANRKNHPMWTKIDCLQSAQVSMLAGNAALRHPYFWAPFVLSGNWR